MFGFGFSPFGEMSYYMLIWMSLLQVYASMSPIVHIVNIGSAATESLANITVLSTKLFVNLVHCFSFSLNFVYLPASGFHTMGILSFGFIVYRLFSLPLHLTYLEH